MQIYNRATGDSAVQELLARTVVAAAPDRLRQVIGDLEAYPRFMPYVTKAEVLDTRGSTRWFFQQLDFPWPISDRYTVIRITVGEEGGEPTTYRIAWTRAPEMDSRRAGDGILIPVNDGHWLLKSLCDGTHTDLTYYVHTEPGGSLPAWVVNMANAVAVPDVIAAVRKRAGSSISRSATDRRDLDHGD